MLKGDPEKVSRVTSRVKGSLSTGWGLKVENCAHVPLIIGLTWYPWCGDALIILGSIRPRQTQIVSGSYRELNSRSWMSNRTKPGDLIVSHSWNERTHKNGMMSGPCWGTHGCPDILRGTRLECLELGWIWSQTRSLF
jgi:hypothetical protein